MMLLTVSHGLLFNNSRCGFRHSLLTRLTRPAACRHKIQAFAPPSWWGSNVVRLPATIWSRLSWTSLSAAALLRLGSPSRHARCGDAALRSTG